MIVLLSSDVGGSTFMVIATVFDSHIVCVCVFQCDNACTERFFFQYYGGWLNRDNYHGPTNSLFDRHENVGRMGSFVGHVEASGNQPSLPACKCWLIWVVCGTFSHIR